MHRDLKAENVMIGKNGTTVKLGDLGAGRILSNTKSMA